MEVFVDFDWILLAIFVTIFITGYIRGAGIELLRVLKVVIPFFVLYFFGDDITNRLLSSKKIVDAVYLILPNIPYKNTIAALSTQIVLYILVYSMLAIFLWRLGKYVLDERIEYVFGRLNSIFGGIFSMIRMYIIISVVIIPFYALNFTNHSDILSNIILKNPPSFSKFGQLIEKSKPTLDKFNDVSSSIKIMDIKSLEKYTSLVIEVKDFIEINEDKGYEVYNYLYKNQMIDQTFDNKSDFLYYYVHHIDEFKELNISDNRIDSMNQDLNQNAKEYEQVFKWAYDEEIHLMENDDDIIQSFIDNYPYITANTEEQLTLDVLAKVKIQTQLYLIIKNWLYDSYQIEIHHETDLLNDNNLELILNDFHLYEADLIESIKRMDAKEDEKEEFLKQIKRFSSFQEEYLRIYQPKIQLYSQLLSDVSFKYKLAFAIMKEHEFNQVVENHIEEDQLMYLFTLDSLNFIDFFQSDDKDIYLEAGKVYVSLFLINFNEEQEVEAITYEQIVNQINAFRGNEDLFNRTKNDINQIFKALLVEKEETSYFEDLVTNGYIEKELLQEMTSSKEVKEFLTPETYIFLKLLNEKINKEVS